MKKSLFHLFLVFLINISVVSANDTWQIKLKDGNTLSGNILSRENGHLKIQTQQRGLVDIKETDIQTVQNITPEALASSEQITPKTSRNLSSATTAGMGSGVEGLEEKMMQDKQVMKIIESLQSDPAFQEILADPNLMNAIKSGDINKIITNPKFMEILNHPKVKQIQEKMNNQ